MRCSFRLNPVFDRPAGLNSAGRGPREIRRSAAPMLRRPAARTQRRPPVAWCPLARHRATVLPALEAKSSSPIAVLDLGGQAAYHFAQHRFQGVIPRSGVNIRARNRQLHPRGKRRTRLPSPFERHRGGENRDVEAEVPQGPVHRSVQVPPWIKSPKPVLNLHGWFRATTGPATRLCPAFTRSTEFRPPKGFGTDSLARGSVIHS